jgi:magnesium chelatase family protein
VRNWKRRPYRAPHHTASAVALVGGGSNPRPGEISMAMHGVLFLDELPEFNRDVLEVLREPLESGKISVSRAARQAEFPARFQLLAAMNPCQCGFLGHYSGRCHCTPDQVTRYRNRISGPLLDRIDLHVEVPALPEKDLESRQSGQSSAVIRERVIAARERQLSRISGLGLSARAYHRILKMARTVADLAGESGISTVHIAEAVQYRRYERI